MNKKVPHLIQLILAFINGRNQYQLYQSADIGGGIFFEPPFNNFLHLQ